MTVFIAIHYTGDKMKGLRWVGHVACMGERRNTCGVLVGKLRERDNFDYPDVDGGLILKWGLKEWDETARIGFIWLRTETFGGLS
jgi:hypothetical protein